MVANPYLVEHQAGIPYAQALGGGMVAGIDGMRFVVPIPSIYARPNRKYFGPDRGVTYLNMITDQAVGLARKVVSGAPRDSLHALDVAFSLDHGQRPDILISDSGAYSDLMFGLCNPLGIEYRPELADMPDQRAWRADRHADHGPLNTLARGRLDLPKIRRHWPDILRVIASIYTGTVRAYDVTRVLDRLPERRRARRAAVLDEDVVRLHPFMRRHLGVQGDYSFMLPALDGRLRELQDPTEGEDEDDDEE